MSVELKAGTLDDFDNSMAACIEKVMDRLWRERYRTDLPAATRDDRRILYVAIAQGIIKHLQDNAEDAFDVDVEVVQTDDSWVKSSGRTDSGGTYAHTHGVTIGQVQSSNNKVMSIGKGKEKVKVKILNTGELYP